MNIEALKAQLTTDEAERRFPYDDATGHVLKQGDTVKGKISIGIGRNLTDKGVSPDERALMLENDIKEHLDLLDRELPWWRNMDETRQLVLANMAFNLGVGPTVEQPEGKLLTFKNTLGHMARAQWDQAADGMAASDWAKQVGPRAQRLIVAMRTGTT